MVCNGIIKSFILNVKIQLYLNMKKNVLVVDLLKQQSALDVEYAFMNCA
jgi:hypothetical protein